MNIHQLIRARKTEKILAELSDATPIPTPLHEEKRTLILEALETSGWAPFHYPRQVNDLAEPWRAHILWDQEAHQVAHHLQTNLGVTTKEPKLAAACHCLILATWLPESDIWKNPQSPPKPEALARDEEHLAASAAMVQNLLLSLTAEGLGTYWSSGGKFRSPEMFRYLGISENERLLAAIFIEYPELRNDQHERKPGALRDKRSTAWIREVRLAE